MKKIFLLSLLILLSGCSKDIDFESFEKKSAKEIFSIGKEEEASKNYSDAVKVFEELERIHPYANLVADAQLAAGDCNYKAKKYNEALSSYEIFVKTHPTHDKVPYAIYMLGMINFEQMPIIERDQESTITALAYFEELCARYPDSSYANESKAKIKTLRNQIAAKEVDVARYYLKKKNYAAAIGRLNVVIDNFLDTAHAPEAMFRLMESYVAMGVVNEAKTVNRLLQKDHKNTEWASYATKLLAGM